MQVQVNTPLIHMYNWKMQNTHPNEILIPMHACSASWGAFDTGVSYAMATLEAAPILGGLQQREESVSARKNLDGKLWFCICRMNEGGHSVQISDSDIDNIVTLYRLRRASGRPADVTWYMCYTGRPNDS